MRILSMVSFLCLFFASCSEDSINQQVRVDDLYMVSIPSFLYSVNDLNSDASLQYMNEAREYYVLVIHEDKAEFHESIYDTELIEMYAPNIDGYANLLIDSFGYNANVKSKTKVTETQINDMPARLVNMQASFDGVDVFCSLAYLEGKENYYQVFAWTLQSNEKEFKSSLNDIAHSLREI